MKFAITANPDIPSAKEAAKAIAALLEGKHEVVLESEVGASMGRSGSALDAVGADVVLAIGGDGTVLRALQRTTAKVLGVNSGSLGFLTEVTDREFPDALARLEAGDYAVEERLKVKVTVDGKRMYDCANEAVLHTAGVAKIRHFEVRVNGIVAQRVRADGIIVATPTGSTSYSMSVGGPIVDPRVEALVVSAIAPFKPSARTVVVPASADLAVGLLRPKECLLVLDGQHEVALSGTEDVRFTGSESRTRLVTFGDDFYRRIEEKLVAQG